MDIVLAHDRAHKDTSLKREIEGLQTKQAFAIVYSSLLEQEGSITGVELLPSSRHDFPVAYSIDSVDPAFPVKIIYVDYVTSNEPQPLMSDEFLEQLKSITSAWEIPPSDTKLPRINKEISRILSSLEAPVKKIKIIFLTNRIVNWDASEDLSKLPSTVSVDIYDLATYADLLDELYNSKRELKVDFPGEKTQQVFTVGPFGQRSQNYETYLAVFPARVLVEMYQSHGQALIERNVRSFLQLRNRVNAGMIETITSAPEMFLAYNNGLAITATGITIKTAKDGSKTISSLTNPQIVNGGQTTAVLYEAANRRNLPLSDVMVQAKVTIVPDPAEAEVLTPMISKFANSQTAVKKTAFDSRDSFHTSLSDISKILKFPTPDSYAYSYYEAKEGDYDQEVNLIRNQEERQIYENYYPRSRKITKLEAATFYNSWEQYPHQVAKGEGINFAFFQDLKDEQKLTANQNLWTTIVGQATLYRAADKIVADLKLGAYKRPTVAYTLALMSDLRNKKLNWKNLVEADSFPEDLASEIRGIAPKVRELIINSAGNKNVLSWAKSPECWSAVRGNFNIEIKAKDVLPSRKTADKYLADNKYLMALRAWSFDEKVGTGDQRHAVTRLIENNQKGKVTLPVLQEMAKSLIELAWDNGFKK
jgi:hypothetical protein